MSWLLCCQQGPLNTDSTQPEPIKFKILRNLNLINPLLNLFILPSKKEIYKFSRQKLFFLQYQNLTHIPCVYFPAKNTSGQLLFIYCHGSGSNLNNIYNFGGNLMNRYGISVLMYDYTGDGESQKQFHSYQIDIKVVLSWALLQGFQLERILLCGFSIGSYSALLLPGPMARILISPVCGIIPFIEGTACQYQGQIFDNIQNAYKIKSRTLILHGAKQMIPYSHAQSIVDTLRINNRPQKIQLMKIQGANHIQMPNVLLKKQAQTYIKNFFQKVKNDDQHNILDYEQKNIKKQLQQISLKLKIFKTLKQQN